MNILKLLVDALLELTDPAYTPGFTEIDGYVMGKVLEKYDTEINKIIYRES